MRVDIPFSIRLPGSALMALVASIAMPGAAQTPTDRPAPPAFVDEQGEEVFGPGYLPDSPDDAGEPLRVGRPTAGFQVSPAAGTRLQAELAEAAGQQARRPAFDAFPIADLPLRRSVRRSLDLPPWNGSRRAAPPVPAGAGAGSGKAGRQEMRVHFVYVGQGAGAILEFPCGVAVIDTGGEFGSKASDGGQMFVDYLDRFFAARPALNRTIDVLFTSHPHMDHLYGLSRIFPRVGPPRYTVRNIVDNGQTGTTGSLGAQSEARAAARAAGAGYSAVELRNQVTATGSTNKVIDPFRCTGVDPVITAFWGSRNEALRSDTQALVRQYRTPNNHSLVLRVDFGKASFLFPGDLQKEGATDLMAEYADNQAAFDVDVLQVSHHGADNGTSDALLRFTSPKIAIISMGDRSATGPGSAFDHGHPRISAIRMMQEAPAIVSQSRPRRIYWAADKQEAPFRKVAITRAIHATGWEGTLVVTARTDGTYAVASAR